MTLTRTGRMATGVIAGGALCMALLGATAHAETGPAWSYSGANGPQAWGTLSPAYATCADGTAQSPIDITTTKSANLRNLVFAYHVGEAGVFNNGHTVEAEAGHGEGNSVTIGKVTYPLVQLHFHAPSEHEVNGKHYPLEIHFVHKTAEGKIAVVGVFVKQGSRNAEWAKFVDVIPDATSNPKDTTIEDFDWAKLLPANQKTIRYDGSLTTPGCAEGVKWNVMPTPIEMSKAQIAAFTDAYSANARPVQPLDGRVPLLDVSSK